MADVTDVATSAPDALGWRNVTAKVTNNSSKRSNYIISVAVESADGKTQITTTAMAVNDLEPGQTTTAKGLVTEEIPADAKVVVKDVTRYAS